MKSTSSKKKQKKMAAQDIEEAPKKKKKKAKKKSPPIEEPDPEPEETEAQKNARKRREDAEKLERTERAFRQLQYMKRRDLLKECVLRGMPFEMSYESTPTLSGWFTDNLDNGQDNNRLIEYDVWREQQLEARGIKKGDALLHPDLRLAITGNIDKMDDHNLRRSTKSIKAPKPDNPDKPPKATKPRGAKDDETGVQSGTRKAMIFSLAKKGVPLDDAIKQTEAVFGQGEVNTKSAKIWYNKALKQ